MSALLSPLRPLTRIGQRFSSAHSGLDLPAPVGTPLFAMSNGNVAFTLRADVDGGDSGNAIGVDSDDGILRWSFSHMQAPSMLAHRARVTTGQVLGHVGLTGLTTGPHLHLSVFRSGTRVDPLPFIVDELRDPDDVADDSSGVPLIVDAVVAGGAAYLFWHFLLRRRGRRS